MSARSGIPAALLLVVPLLAFCPDAFAQTQCWAPREDQDTVTNPKWAPQLRAMMAAEKIARDTPAFLSTPEPVRMRTTIAAGPYDPTGARLLVRAYPEKSTVGIQIWTGKCEVIPQAERVAASIGQIDVFFNYPVAETFLGDGGIPKKTGEVAGYPEYNYWIVITKDGRLPWIPQTLADRLDREGQRREQSLAEWRKDLVRMNVPDAATTAVLEKGIADYKRYRASFSAEQLAQPGVWADVSGEAKLKLDARIQQLHELSPSEQQQYDSWTREARALDRQAREADKTNKDEAQRLRTRSNEFAMQAHELRNTHREQVGSKILAASAEFDLFNIRPGPADRALGFKADPTFPDPKSPTRIQLITVMIPTVDTRKGRDAWSKQTKATFDYAALAKLLD